MKFKTKFKMITDIKSKLKIKQIFLDPGQQFNRKSVLPSLKLK